MESSKDSFEERRAASPNLFRAITDLDDGTKGIVPVMPLDFGTKSLPGPSLTAIDCDAAGPSGFYENSPTDKSVQTTPCAVDLASSGDCRPGPSGLSQIAEVTSSSIDYTNDHPHSLVNAFGNDDSKRSMGVPDPPSEGGTQLVSSPEQVTSKVTVMADQAVKAAGFNDGPEHESWPAASGSKSKVECEPGKSEVTVAARQDDAEIAPKIEEGHIQPSHGEEGHRPEQVSSPEPNCAICLGKMQNKSFTNSCFHQFCFTCLLEWSKVKAECPLCKQPFKSIVHNVRSMEDYDQYYLRSEEFNTWDYPSASASASRFRYRSTLTSERRRELNLGRLLTTHHAPTRSSTSSSSAFVPVRHLYSTSDYRRYIYERDLWVVNNVRSTRMTRMREANPEFYSANPACTHRLLPWLNRELNALNYGHQTAFLLELIMSLVLRFHIQSPEFVEHLRPYFRNNTAHFVHEFHSFARSPYDMGEYDRHSRYDDVTSPSESGNDDPDVVVLSHHENVAPLRQGPSGTSVIGLGSSRFGVSRAGHPSLINRARDFLANLQSNKARPATLASTSSAGQPGPSSSPQPGPSGVGNRTGGGALAPPSMATMGHVVSSSDDDSEDDLFHSIINARALARLRTNGGGVQQDRKPHITTINVDDEDDCMIVDVVGKTPRSPVAVIQLSDSDDDVQIEGGGGSPFPATPVSRLSTPTSSSSTELTPTPPPPPKLPSLKIKLSLTKARKATLAASRAARRKRLQSESLSGHSASTSETQTDSCVRSPSPTSNSSGTPNACSSGSLSSRHRLVPTPDDDSTSSTDEASVQHRQQQTVRSKVIRLDPNQDSVGGSSTSELYFHDHSGQRSGGKNSSSSRSRSRSHSQQSSHSSSGVKHHAPKKHHSSGKHRRRRLVETTILVSDETTNNDSSSKLPLPRKKSKKHKHHKSGGGSKHKHSRQSKILKKDESSKT